MANRIAPVAGSTVSVWRSLRNLVLCSNVLSDFNSAQAPDLETAAISVNTYEKMEAILARELAGVVGET